MDNVDPDALLREASVGEQVQAMRLLKAVYRPMKWIIASCECDKSACTEPDECHRMRAADMLQAFCSN